MKTIVRVSKSFKRLAKPLLKKYSSLANELLSLENELLTNPKFGIPLGRDSYKIRLAVKSKGRGKSGGLRVITHLDTEMVCIVEEINENYVISLIAIYDKNETATISDKELKELIEQLQSE
jgi:mRNA-degrading endonuclease RelE of RelBE toxin-antitoxin system